MFKHRHEIFKVVKIQVKISWLVMPCNVAVGYLHFRRPCCLHLHGEVNGTGKKGTDIRMAYNRRAESSSQ